MTKIIQLERKFPNEGLLGTFVNEDSYDLLVTEDADVYKPSIDGELSEENCLLKLRRSVFPANIQKVGLAGLGDAARISHNRGLAAGKALESESGARERVSFLHMEVLEYYSKRTSDPLPGIDPIQEIIDRYAAGDKFTAMVFLTQSNFDFDAWFAERHTKSAKQLKDEATNILKTHVSSTHYANSAHSGIAGYFDRYVRIPYCRTTSYTAENKELFESAYPYIDAVSDQFKKLMPERYAKQLETIEKIDPAFRVHRSVYTTITCNKTFRTACHRDAGDLAAGFGCITSLDNGKRYDNAYLVFPEYRVAVDLRPGDMLCFDPHEIHGNTQIEITEEGAERYSFVFYMREGTLQCETAKIEELRYNFVRSRADKTGSRKFNGVSEGMWSSEEWMNYLLNNGMKEYVDANLHQFKLNTSSAVSLFD